MAETETPSAQTPWTHTGPPRRPKWLEADSGPAPAWHLGPSQERAEAGGLEAAARRPLDPPPTPGYGFDDYPKWDRADPIYGSRAGFARPCAGRWRSERPESSWRSARP